jgi:hypothetical protein
LGLGQPSVLKGQSHEENQVSSTSSSCLISPLPHLGQAVGWPTWSAHSCAQSSQVNTGMRCPHQIWREMHQSRMFSIHSR